MARHANSTCFVRWAIAPIVAGALFVPSTASMQDIQTETLTSAPRVAPGESMPVRVHLTNFGSTARTDAVITYSIIDAEGSEILSDTETAAVDTTASFIHAFLLPQSIKPGGYTMRVAVVYQEQQTPALSSYQFTVERKFFGLFESDLLKYGFTALMTIMFILGVVWIFEIYHHGARASHDYSAVPNNIRIYYEIIGDVIQQMRLHEGDKALTMAAQLPGLMINSASGKVTDILGDPATVAAALVSEYEKTFGKKVNLSLAKGVRRRAIVK